MMVKEVIEMLQKFSPDADVYLYSLTTEEGDEVDGVLSEDEAEEIYFHSNTPWNSGDTNFVVITGS